MLKALMSAGVSYTSVSSMFTDTIFHHQMVLY